MRARIAQQPGRARLGVLVLFVLALGAAGAFWLWQRLAPDESAGYLTQQARALNFDAERIVRFVRDDVRSDAYEGVLRGPVGALWARAGNDADRALLLHALLDRAKAPHRLVRGQTYGVELLAGQTARYVGPARDSDPGAQPIEAPNDGEFHTVEVRVRTAGPSGEITDQGRTFRTAELAGADLRLFYRRQGDRTAALLEGAGQETEVAADVTGAQRQEALFRLAGPGAAPLERRRELFTRTAADFPSFFDAENRYAFVITTGWIPESVAQRESSAAQRENTPPDALNHTLAYTFLARSDAAAQQVMAAKGVAAWFTSPRITIASSEIDAAGGQRMRALSLDLRKNDVHIEGPEDLQAAFATLRSLYDAALEPAVLQALTGQQTISGADLLAGAAARRQATLAERQLTLRRALERLLNEAPDGASLTVAPAGPTEAAVQIARAGGRLQVTVSDAVRRGLAGKRNEDFWLLSSPEAEAGDLDRLARETEAALAVAAQLPMSYRQTIAYNEAPPPQWYLNARFFRYDTRSGELLFEHQYRTLEPEILAEVIDYYDDINQRRYDRPRPARVATRKEDAGGAAVVTSWFSFPEDRSPGRTWDMLSRQTYEDVKSQGAATIRVRDHQGRDSEPVKLWLIERRETVLTINNRSVKVPVLVLAGDFAARDPVKPANDRGPDRTMPDDGQNEVVNKFVVLDDPQLPWILSRFYTPEDKTYRVQSSVPGRITDAQSGDGVPDAKVTVRGPEAAATSWPDGQFSLPLMKEPFREFEIAVAAPGYKPAVIKRDFRQAATFPLALRLEREPAADGFVWLEASTAGSDLSGLKLSQRGSQLITDLLRDHRDRAVAVPRFPVYYPYGRIDAWLEIDAQSHEVYPRLTDGLYGSTLHSLTPEPYAFQRGAIEYFSGRIASWYLFAAGALDSVALHMDQPEMTPTEMHKHAISTARQMAAMYDSMLVSAAAGWGSRPPLVGSKLMSAAFKKGLKDGLAWADEFYKQAWGA